MEKTNSSSDSHMSETH